LVPAPAAVPAHQVMVRPPDRAAVEGLGAGHQVCASSGRAMVAASTGDGELLGHARRVLGPRQAEHQEGCFGFGLAQLGSRHGGGRVCGRWSRPDRWSQPGVAAGPDPAPTRLGAARTLVRPVMCRGRHTSSAGRRLVARRRSPSGTCDEVSSNLHGSLEQSRRNSKASTLYGADILRRFRLLTEVPGVRRGDGVTGVRR
jgi:hypothetical protein